MDSHNAHAVHRQRRLHRQGSVQRVNDEGGPVFAYDRLRRAQTFLRIQGIEISFTREGRAGTRAIRISAGVENPATIVTLVSTVGTVSPASSGCHNISTDLGRSPQGLVP